MSGNRSENTPLKSYLVEVDPEEYLMWCEFNDENPNQLNFRDWIVEFLLQTTIYKMEVKE